MTPCELEGEIENKIFIKKIDVYEICLLHKQGPTYITQTRINSRKKQDWFIVIERDFFVNGPAQVNGSSMTLPTFVLIDRR